VGYDLFSASVCVIPGGGQSVVATVLQFEFPEGFDEQIVGRSNGAALYGIHVGGGIIRFGFRENVKVVLMNVIRHGYLLYQED
jgi:dUTP pyrophosphatase